MNFKSLLTLFTAFYAMSTFAQSKTFTFNEIQSRNNKQQWDRCESVAERVAQFTPGKIDVQVDRKYNLDIISTTFLPDKGTIYLCLDEMKNKVTVMLIDNDKMYLYNDTKRFLINFNHSKVLNASARSYADVD